MIETLDPRRGLAADGIIREPEIPFPPYIIIYKRENFERPEDIAYMTERVGELNSALSDWLTEKGLADRVRLFGVAPTLGVTGVVCDARTAGKIEKSPLVVGLMQNQKIYLIE